MESWNSWYQTVTPIGPEYIIKPAAGVAKLHQTIAAVTAEYF